MNCRAELFWWFVTGRRAVRGVAAAGAARGQSASGGAGAEEEEGVRLQRHRDGDG